MKTIYVEYAIIGAGTSGLGAYSTISRQTDSVVMIQDGPYGTTCARVGCMPSKLLITAADYAYHLNTSDFFGVPASGRVDGPKVLERLRRERDHRFVARNLSYVDKIPAHHKLEGRARFVGPGRLRVDESIEVNAKKVILACGSRPAISEVFEPVMDRVLTSDTVFELEDLPRSVAVIGMGVIALELGQALHRLGVETILYGRSGKINALTHPTLQQQAIDILGAELDIYPCGRVLSTWENDEGAWIEYQQENGQRITRVFDRVLVATGRVSNVDRLTLEQTGIEVKEDGTVSFDPQTMRCSNLPIFIAGDATDHLPVWHEAYDEGRIAADNALHYPSPSPATRRTPLMVFFTDPQIAVVGLTFQQLEGREIVIGELPSASPRHVVWNKVQGRIHVYVDARTDVILGAELLGYGAEHLAHLLALAITHDMTTEQVLQMPIYHPCAEELLRDVLIDIQKKRRRRMSQSRNHSSSMA
ncbi:dihydrolipoyl dehydrogenase [Halomonas sp. MCCC 1A17488]|uniref:dihydrolipoyl dehydrogenase n=1 Tax=unclassified Halomonas TaxID=2609666 RepID=UPI0018D2492C|nr:MULTISPECIES: dihydrolipoyl dehydrogenase [unclassified Halomonas]MCE8017722.1 dihydrolipoyl dehydrogenase [Halomonas sp. MCCC 1A17488]MCG3241055.1 dihydrolipoyl dehydrogenase [Halomonas sp. MCCC 1A17488]QPP48918.1 dihydrolipoyl dehydrogenase [Halomonas sp. SS10-MC5]